MSLFTYRTLSYHDSYKYYLLVFKFSIKFYRGFEYQIQENLWNSIVVLVSLHGTLYHLGINSKQILLIIIEYHDIKTVFLIAPLLCCNLIIFCHPILCIIIQRWNTKKNSFDLTERDPASVPNQGHRYTNSVTDRVSGSYEFLYVFVTDFFVLGFLSFFASSDTWERSM